KVDLRLPCRRDLMMVFLDHNTHLLHLIDHFTANVLLGINGWNREIAFLMARFVAEVEALFAGIPDSFVRIDEVVAAVARLIVAGIIEDKELGFRSPVRDIADPRRL